MQSGYLILTKEARFPLILDRHLYCYFDLGNEIVAIHDRIIKEMMSHWMYLIPAMVVKGVPEV